MKPPIYIAFFLLAALNMHAQTADMYLAPGTSMFFSDKEGVGIYGNVQVAGSMGQATGNVIEFYGQSWVNDTSAAFPDETIGGFTSGKGGEISFRQPHPLYGNLGVQTVSGNYNVLDLLGPSLPSVSVNNPSGLVLMNQDVSVRNNLELQSGHIYLNGYNLALGHAGGAGHITGYNENRFVVTGTAQTGGSLSLLNLPSGTDTVVFPIGTDEGAYTPAAIVNNGPTDHFRARVFDGVLENGLSGTDISDRSVNKTWIISSAMNSLQATLLLQHKISDEGGLYQANRQYSYLSRLNANQWDTGGSILIPPVDPGWLTTGIPVADGAVSQRSLSLSAGPNTHYFTSLVRERDIPPCTAQFTYFLTWKEGSFKTKLNWGVLARPGIVSYHVEKRIGWAGVWKTAAVVPASNVFDYTWEDTDVFYDEPLFYRIRLNCQTGEHLYSDLRTMREGEIAIIYPNPTGGKFTLTVADPSRVKAAVVYDAAGKKVRLASIVSQDTEFDISDFAAGVYMITVVSTTDQRLITLKVLKTN